MEQTNRHMDCRNYAPVDVAKGICHARKEMVLADTEACELFTRLPKCKHCQHYIPGAEEYLGSCSAVKILPMTYPDLASVTCEWFTWQEAG